MSKTYRITKCFKLEEKPSWEDAAREHGLIVSLEEAGLEEEIDEPAHGTFHSNEGSIYSYTDWFYDGDESAFSII